MFSVDGIEWNIPCSIKRASEITPSEISGLLLNRQYFNDVLGTFMKYDVTIAVPLNYMDEYSTLYETLSAPVDGHEFVFPYNEDTITITGRVQVISDEWVKMPKKKNHWRKTSFSVIANHPSKYKTLGEVVTIGLTPLPTEASPTIGDLFEYTASGWVQRHYDNADNISY